MYSGFTVSLPCQISQRLASVRWRRVVGYKKYGRFLPPVHSSTGRLVEWSTRPILLYFTFLVRIHESYITVHLAATFGLHSAFPNIVQISSGAPCAYELEDGSLPHFSINAMAARRSHDFLYFRAMRAKERARESRWSDVFIDSQA